MNAVVNSLHLFFAQNPMNKAKKRMDKMIRNKYSILKNMQSANKVIPPGKETLTVSCDTKLLIRIIAAYSGN